MAKFMTLAIDLASDLFLAGSDWTTVREISAINAAAVVRERQRYVAFAKGVR